jgi:hypothetical protein
VDSPKKYERYWDTGADAVKGWGIRANRDKFGISNSSYKPD